MSAEWMDEAACLGADPDDMQPEVAAAADVAYAARVCEGCPVRLECREAAEAQDRPYGIWGGRWYGAEPRDPSVPACTWCGGEVEPDRSTSRYCGVRCRVAAHRARRVSA